jgi:hypothetical protein
MKPCVNSYILLLLVDSCMGGDWNSVRYFVRIHFAMYCLYKGSRGNAVGIPTDYGLDGFGVGLRILVRERLLSPPRCPDRF